MIYIYTKDGHVIKLFYIIKLINNYHDKIINILIKLILKYNIILKYKNILLTFKYNHFKYDIYYTLIKPIHYINIQLLIKITELIFNNQLKIYELYDNMIKNIILNTNIKCIKKSTDILEELIIQNMEMYINTTRYKRCSSNKRKRSNKYRKK